MLRQPALIILTIIYAAALVACGAASGFNSPATYPIDPIFREFFAQIGGEALLGPAISQRFEEGSLKCQYTVRAKICYNPYEVPAERFSLASIGKQLTITAGEPVPIENGEGMLVDNIMVYPDFLPLYESLFGQTYSGKPLTPAFLNRPNQRIEQYFENVGFARDLSTEPDDAYLLPYGYYDCGNLCSSYRSQVDPRDQELIAQPAQTSATSFLNHIEGLGGQSVFGKVLAGPYPAPEGGSEMVFETVVLYSPGQSTGPVLFRPISRLLGMTAVNPIPHNPSLPDVVFYPVTGDLGYHVPNRFDHFLKQHGGLALSGLPIGEVYASRDIPGGAYQCFENICLEGDPSKPEGQNVSLAPLGSRYIDLKGIPENAQEDETPRVKWDQLFVTTREVLAQVAPGGTQRIYAQVTDNNTNQPVPDIEARLTLYMQGSTSELLMPPSNGDGLTSTAFQLPGDMRHGLVVPFEVCLNIPVSPPVCDQDVFLVWR